MSKIEEYKKEKDGLDILHDVPRYAAEGWEAITDGDKERRKWAGVFFRRQTPGHFMMRLRIPNGILSAVQLRAIGELSGAYGKGFAVGKVASFAGKLDWFSRAVAGRQTGGYRDDPHRIQHAEPSELRLKA